MDEKPVTRSEALSIFKSFNCLENCLLALVWNDILDRFNAVNKVLQSANTILHTVVEMYQSLINFVNTMRTNFDQYEKKAVEKSNVKEYSRETSRRRKNSLRLSAKRK